MNIKTILSQAIVAIYLSVFMVETVNAEWSLFFSGASDKYGEPAGEAGMLYATSDKEAMFASISLWRNESDTFGTLNLGKFITYQNYLSPHIGGGLILSHYERCEESETSLRANCNDNIDAGILGEFGASYNFRKINTSLFIRPMFHFINQRHYTFLFGIRLSTIGQL